MARLLIGVSGGIAAYKALETVRLAVKAGHAVRVLQTHNSLRFVGRASFEGLTGAPVLVEEFEPDPARGAFPGEPVPERAPISHLALVERADAYLIAPASANTIARLAHGHAENLLSTAALAAACPVAVAPAMNHRMYLHPATQHNLETLRARGVHVVDPGEGELASHGEHGLGRLAEPAQLLAVWEGLAGAAAGGATAPGPGAQGTWRGVRVLVTAGGTREPIDSVRYIGNRSSGRMGVALAVAALERGAEVTLVAANLSVDPPPGARTIPVQTAAELREACRHEFPGCDVLLMAAAVADFRPAAPVTHKLKKDYGPPPPIGLEPTPDVLSELAARRQDGQLIVGFAAEHGPGGLDYARGKLERKRLDAVVLNDVGAPGIGFDSEENEVVVVTAAQERPLPRACKQAVARALLDELERLREGSGDGASRLGTAGAARG